MENRWTRYVALLLIAACGYVHAAPRVDYFESLTLKPILPELQFEAYGHRFVLELEPNDRLSKKLRAQQKQLPSNFRLFRGTIKGVPGSWVRLAGTESHLEGMMWDGQDLYAVTTYERIARLLAESAQLPASQPVIYRLSDTHSLVPENFCATPGDSRNNGIESYKSLVRELQAAAAASSVSTLEVSMIADGDMQRGAFEATSWMLTVANGVDGIFAEQVGVLIEPTDVRLVPQTADPFTTTNPERLLSQLEVYRSSTPEVRQRGLAYLLTGKDLDEDVLGIANIGALCDPTTSVALGQGSGSISAILVAAHEFGHVFGAPHDGQGACASTAPVFLMSPVMNGSSQFSSCSLAHMSQVLSSATCLTAGGSWSDVSVAIGSPDVTPANDEPFTMPITVSSVGSLQAENVTAQIQVSDLWKVSSLPAEGTCSGQAPVIDCEFGAMAPGQQVTVNLTAVSHAVGQFQVAASVAADNDRFSSNSHAQSQVIVAPVSDVSLTVTPATLNLLTDAEGEITLTVTSRLSRAVRDVTVSINTSAALQAATVSNGSCTLSASGATCVLGTIDAGTARNIALKVKAPSYVGGSSLTASVTAANDTDATNNFAGADIRFNPRRDVGFASIGGSRSALVNEWIEEVFVVTSFGPETVNNVQFELNVLGIGSEFSSISAESGTCTSNRIAATCVLGALPPGESRHITFVARGTQDERIELRGYVYAADDQQLLNNSFTQNVAVRYGQEVTLLGPVNFEGFETLATSFSTRVWAVGAFASQNVELALDMPASVRLAKASMAGAICEVGSPTHAVCKLEKLEPSIISTMSIEAIGDVAGTYTGTLTVSADQDGDTSNNTAPVQLTLRPYTDIAVAELAPVPLLLVGDTAEVPIRITTGLRPVTDARVSVSIRSSAIILESLSSSLGSCVVEASRMLCMLGNLPGHAEVQMSAKLRAEAATNTSMDVLASIAVDAQPGNSAKSLALSSIAPSDADLRLRSESVTTTAQQSFSLPTLTVTGTADMPDAIVEIALPDSITLVTANVVPIGGCSLTSPVRCTVAMSGALRSVSIDAAFRSAVAGTFTLTAKLIASNDVTPDNNVRSVVVTVSAAAPPPTSSPPASSGGGGGGGGGSMSFVLLSILAAMASRIRCPAVRNARRSAAPRVSVFHA
jgi:hypothetical protein